MRKDYPSSRWLSKWEEEFVKNGGHNGLATINALRPYAVDYYREGANPRVAGMATATQYKLYPKKGD